MNGATGGSVKSDGMGALAIGSANGVLDGANANGEGATAIGSASRTREGASAMGSGSLALGAGAVADSFNGQEVESPYASTAIGENAVATGGGVHRRRCQIG